MRGRRKGKEEKSEKESLVRQGTTATVRNGLRPGQPSEWEGSASGFNSPPIAQNFLKRNNTKKLEMLQLASLEIFPLELYGASCYTNKRALELNSLGHRRGTHWHRGTAPPGKFGEHPLRPVKESSWAPLGHTSPLITQESHKPVNCPLDPWIKLTTPLRSFSQPKQLAHSRLPQGLRGRGTKAESHHVAPALTKGTRLDFSRDPLLETKLGSSAQTLSCGSYCPGPCQARLRLSPTNQQLQHCGEADQLLARKRC